MNRLDPINAMAGGRLPMPIKADGGRMADKQIMPLISQYFSIARRRKWVIIGTIVAALLVGLLITLLMTPQYTSTATLEIQRETRNFTQVQGAQPDEQASSLDQEFYETQYGLLQAKSLAQAVATSLRFYDDPKFFDLFGVNSSKMFTDGRPIGGNATRADRISAAASILLKHFNVSPDRLSRLVTISFTSPDAAVSKRVVDAWSAQFVSTTLERRFDATAYARKFLEQRLVQLRNRIDESERQLVTYAAQQGIVNLPASTPAQDGGLSGERSLAADDLATLNRELARATADRVQAESRLNGTGDAGTESLESATLSQLRSRRAELASDYARLMAQFEPGYPPAQALKSQLDQISKSIATEENRITRTLQENYGASTSREQMLRDTVSRLKTGVLDTRRRSIQYNIYQRDADTNRQLYDALLQRYKEIGVAGGVGVNNISVVDPAEVASRPSSPRLMLNMFLSLLAGSALGIGLALAMEQIDEAISDPVEVEELLEVPLLGTIPRMTEGSPLEALADRKSSLSEAYLSLRTTLSFTTDHGLPRTLAVTSTRAGEGKSTTSYALARSLARSNRRTLLIDSDMRSPSVHTELGVPNKEGLSNYLSGNIDSTDQLIFATGHDGLFAMTAGPQPPSAPELLTGDRFEALIAELRNNFDHIVFDAPPVLGLADAPLIGSAVEGTIFVIESHNTKKSMARVAIGRMQSANVLMLGAVLTKFDDKRAHYGYGYHYGHSYGYGDQTTEKS